MNNIDVYNITFGVVMKKAGRLDWKKTFDWNIKCSNVTFIIVWNFSVENLLSVKRNVYHQ